jgi:D-arabinose 1-dehydrogenase-like Zn-dependent alcohol dehydrogenase
LQHPAKFAYKLPEKLPSDRTPPLLCAGVTVYAPLAKYCKAGDKVGVLGIGGLGHLAVAYANKLGCHVTAFTSTPGKEEFIKKFGAHEVRSSSNAEELKKGASEFDVMINTLSIANDKMFGLYLDLTAADGTFIQVGAPPIGEPFSIHAFQLIGKNLRMAGSHVGSRKQTEEMLEFSAKHDILPLCEFFSFEDFPKALNTLENGKPIFRCVVNVEEWSKKNGFFKEY